MEGREGGGGRGRREEHTTWMTVVSFILAVGFPSSGGLKRFRPKTIAKSFRMERWREDRGRGKEEAEKGWKGGEGGWREGHTAWMTVVSLSLAVGSPSSGGLKRFGPKTIAKLFSSMDVVSENFARSYKNLNKNFVTA
jgi:hypothetical protein